MKSFLKKSFPRYVITILIGAGLVWLTLDLHGYSSLTSQVDRYRLLCDAFTIPGMILLMLGLLVLVSGSSGLDGITYVLHWLRLTLIPFGGKQPRYADHVQRRRERKKVHGGFLIISGCLFLAAAIVFLILFYSLYRS